MKNPGLLLATSELTAKHEVLFQQQGTHATADGGTVKHQAANHLLNWPGCHTALLVVSVVPINTKSPSCGLSRC